MKLIIGVRILGSKLAASVLPIPVIQGPEIYHGYYILFTKQFSFRFLSFIGCKLFPATKKTKTILFPFKYTTDSQSPDFRNWCFKNIIGV